MTAAQVEIVTALVYDDTEDDYFYDRPEDVQARYCEITAKAMRRAGIEVSR